MTSSVASTATPMHHAFERRVDDVRPVKGEINALILDYLRAEGYPSAAERFSREANLRPMEDHLFIMTRNQIRHDIHSGRIKSAIETINDFSPMILESDSALHFALLRLQLIELIRQCHATGGDDITPSLSFASAHLAPRASTNSAFLEDLERTMALILFPLDQLEPQLAALLKPELRKAVADKVNKAVLACHRERREAAIRDLVRLRTWAEDSARAGKKDLPRQIEIGVQVEDASRDGDEDSDAMVS